MLRCDVILDVIDKFGVLTTTRELYLEEAPETFELLAQDSQGNAFTTLEGIEFHWEITSQNFRSIDTSSNKAAADWKQVLRFLTFSESKYHEVPKTVENFEYLGLRGYMVLLEGINTGSAKVSVRLPHPEYKHVPEVSVDIMVLANLLLDPIDVHILVGDEISFRVLQLKQGKLEEISLNSQYYLEIEDKSKASLKDRTATGVALGRTFVVLKDRNVPDDKLNGENKPPLPKASLTVAAPHRISINLLPYFNWVTVVNEEHDIALDLYTKDDHRITLGSKYKFDTTFDKNLFREMTSLANKSRIHGETMQIGTSEVVGRFSKVSGQVFSILHIFHFHFI